MNMYLWDSNNWQLHNAIPINKPVAYLWNCINWHGCTLCLGVSNSNVTMKFVRLHYFYHKILGDKRYFVPLCSKVGGNIFSWNSVLECSFSIFYCLRWIMRSWCRSGSVVKPLHELWSTKIRADKSDASCWSNKRGR